MVVLGITSGDTDEAVVDQSSLTFTRENWDQPQTVTVTGVDDAVFDGHQDSIITIAVDDFSSDSLYDSLADSVISVTTTDDTPSDFGDAPNRFKT